jgi:hypothetical protein
MRSRVPHHREPSETKGAWARGLRLWRQAGRGLGGLLGGQR